MAISLKKVLALLLAFALCISFAGCSARKPEDVRFRVVTSFYPIYIMTLNITNGVSGVQVDNMAGQQTGCLHDYQLQSKDMKNIEQADVFVINGAGMENFISKVTLQLPKLPVIDSSKGVSLLEEDSEANPHTWVSITNYITQVNNVARGLMKADAAHAKEYQTNAQTYVAKLTALRDKMHSELENLPNRDIITFHEAFPYFAKEFNLNIAKVINREPDSQPSAKELAETIHLIKSTNVKAVFAEPQYPRSAANVVAKECGVKVYSLDPSVTGENKLSAYLDAMENNLAVLKEALKG